MIGGSPPQESMQACHTAVSGLYETCTTRVRVGAAKDHIWQRISTGSFEKRAKDDKDAVLSADVDAIIAAQLVLGVRKEV